MLKALFCLSLIVGYVLLLFALKKGLAARNAIKQTTALLFIVLLSPFFSSLTADAASTISIDDRGGYFNRGPYYDAERDAIRYQFNSTALKKSKIEYFHDAGFTQAGTVREATATNYYSYVSFYCTGYYRQTFYDAAGNVLITFKLSIAAGDLKNPTCDSGPGKDDDEGGKETCNNCAIFECPGWSDYMGKLEDIKNAIPPPPNWHEVADIFRDSIAPQIKKDLAEVIGRAPEPTMPDLPKAPDLPAAPPALPSLDDKDFKDDVPKGDEAPGLGDAGFTADDIKDKAPNIPERDDPTGGFDITDPIGSLPSQEEFEQNAPNEGTAPLPAPPKEQENKAPVPGDTADAPPVPNDTPDKPPVPGADNSTAPVPGADNSTAPIPGLDGSTAPIPKE